MLPMLDLVHASDRGFKMVYIVFCVGRLILLAQMHTTYTASWLEGKIKSNNYIFFSFNDTVLSRNILAYCRMRWRRDWFVMAAVGYWWPPWPVGAWFTCFYLHTSCVMCPSKKSCQCGVPDFAYVGNVETWSKNLCVQFFSQRNPFQKNTISYIFMKKTIQPKMLSVMRLVSKSNTKLNALTSLCNQNWPK